MQKIARVLKSNGTDGELLVSLFGIAPEDIDLQEPVYIYHDGLPVPYFILSCRRRGENRLLVCLSGVHSLADADELQGRDVFSEALSEEDEGDIRGWTVLDEHGATIGNVADYEDIPGNLCLWVDTEKGQVLLPLHPDLILSTDSNASTIRLRLPEGILDL